MPYHGGHVSQDHHSIGAEGDLIVTKVHSFVCQTKKWKENCLRRDNIFPCTLKKI